MDCCGGETPKPIWLKPVSPSNAENYDVYGTLCEISFAIFVDTEDNNKLNVRPALRALFACRN